MMPRRPYLSLSTFIILCYILFRVAFLFQKWDRPGTEATLSWDVFGYYLYLPATLIYEDLGGLGFWEDIWPDYRPAGDFHHAVKQPDGQYVMKYPIGMALMYLPFFLLAHGYAALAGFPMDGFSWPYQFFVSMGGIVYAVLGLWVMRSLLLRQFSDTTTALCLGTLVLCTNYLNYVSIDGAMPHNYLFTLYALILWLTIQWHAHPKLLYAALIGALVGLATIIRPTELIAILIPLLWGITDRASFQQKQQLLLKHLPHVGLLALCLFAVGSIQLVYWKLYSGSFLYYSYEEQGFSWLSPHLIDGIFSARKGWLAYTPVMALSLLGFVVLYRTHRTYFWPMLVYVVLNTYIVFSWDIWWYGGGFGARALIPSYALLLFPLAALIQGALRRNYTQYALLAALFLCMDLNLLMTWQAHAPGQILHPEYMTRAYYWKIFGNAMPDRADKKFLDVKRELGSLEHKRVLPLYRNDMENDSIAHRTREQAFSGAHSVKLTPDQPYSPTYEISLHHFPHPSKKDWVTVSARLFYTDVEWNEYAMGQLIVQFLREGDEVPYKGTYVKIQRLCEPWQWHHLHFDMRFPRKVQPTDRIRFFATNEWGTYPVYIDDMKLDLVRPD